VKPIVLRSQLGVHQRPIRLGQRCRARRGHLLEFLSQMLHFVGVIAGDFVPEGSLDFFGRGRWCDRKKLVKGLHLLRGR
jgi:hypothetical protein